MYSPRLLFVFISLSLLPFCNWAQCNQDYVWANWSDFTGNSAIGTVIPEDTVQLVMSSNFNFSSTPGIYNYTAFAACGTSNPPNTTVPRTTWAVGSGGITEMCFSRTVANPILMLASIGNPGSSVTLEFSRPYDLVCDGGGVNYISDTSLIGAEGYTIIRFPGDFNCVTIYSSTPENYTNISWGLNPPLFEVSVDGDSIACGSIILTASGGISYQWSGGETPNEAENTFLSSGTYFLTVTDENGCEVVTSRNIQIDRSDTLIELAREICEGEEYNGISESGIYFDTSYTELGCQIIERLDLNVWPIKHTSEVANICQGQSYLGYNSTGRYTILAQSSNGCDSNHTLNLEVLESYSERISLQVCEGEGVEFGGSIVSQSGVYIDSLKSVGSCDSILTLDLDVLPIMRSQVDVVLCHGEKYTMGNQILFETGMYQDTLSSSLGCDSMVNVNLTVLPQLIDTFSFETCDGNSFQLNGIDLVESGFYSDTLMSVSGCDSVVYLQLRVHQRFRDSSHVILCKGEHIDFGGIMIEQEGLFMDSLISNSGCDSISILLVSKEITDFLGLDTLLCQAEEFTIVSPYSNTIWFDNTVGETKTVCSSGQYWAKLQSTIGCENMDTISVRLNNLSAYVPNAFSPNFDNLNECFQPYFSPGDVSSFRFNIYNRWGSLVFSTKDYEACWNGEFRGKPCNPGVYLYTIEYSTNTCKDVLISGDVSLIR